MTTASAASSAASIVAAASTPFSAAISAARSATASATTSSSMPSVAARSSACSAPILPAPMSATRIVRLPRAETTQLRRKHAAPDRRCLRRRAPAAVLLDHQPAVVAALRQQLEDRGEVDDACTELGEETGPDRSAEVGHASGVEFREHVGVDVLQVNVGDALAVPPQRLDGVAAADRPVADIQADPDALVRDRGEERLHLVGVLDERPGVGMEGDRVPRGDGLGDDRVDEAP